MGNVDQVNQDKIQNATLAAINNIIGPRIEFAVRSIIASSPQDLPVLPQNQNVKKI